MKDVTDVTLPPGATGRASRKQYISKDSANQMGFRLCFITREPKEASTKGVGTGNPSGGSLRCHVHFLTEQARC